MSLKRRTPAFVQVLELSDISQTIAAWRARAAQADDEAARFA